MNPLYTTSGSLITFFLLKSFFRFLESEISVFHALLYGKKEIFKWFRYVLCLAGHIRSYIGKVFTEFLCNATILFIDFPLTFVDLVNLLELSLLFPVISFIICYVRFMSFRQSLSKD